jgi:hypothetical protein
MAPVDQRLSSLDHVKQLLKAFNADLKSIRELWSPEASTAVDPGVTLLKDGLATLLECWDIHFPNYNKASDRLRDKISKREKVQSEDVFSFLRLAYVLFAQPEYLHGVRGSSKAASIMLQILESSGSEFMLLPRAVIQNFAQSRTRMGSCLNVIQVKWAILLTDMNLVPLLQRPGYGFFRLFEKDETLETLAITGEDGTVTFIRPGRMYSCPSYPDKEKSSQTSDRTQSAAGTSHESYGGEKRDLYCICRSKDFDFDSNEMKAGAEVLCWTTLPREPNWSAGSPVETVWTRSDGLSFLGAQNICQSGQPRIMRMYVICIIEVEERAVHGDHKIL